jgi:hypothetical protein
MADCNDPSATHAQAAAGVFGILSMIDCAVTASDSAMGDLNEPEPFPPTKMDPVVENPRPPANEVNPETLSAPVMVNPSLNPSAPLRISSAQKLLDLISDSTQSGKSERGTQFDIYFRQDGQMVGRTIKGNVDEGIWEAIKDGKYCRQWNKWRDASRDCYYVYKLDNGEYRFKAIEKPYETLVWITRGDPKQLKRRISTVEGAPLRQVRIEDTGVPVATAASVGATAGPEQVPAEAGPLQQVKTEDPGVATAAAASARTTSGPDQVTAEKALLRQVKTESTGVAVAAAASVGAISGPDQMTAERTSSQQESQPEYLRVALLPFTAKFPNSNGAIFLEPELEEFSKKFLGRRSGLKLTYSYYQPELGGGPQLNPAMIWKGNLNKLPKKSEIYSIADKLDADLALTFFHTLRTGDWTAYDLFSVDVYLFDLAYERMYHVSGHERNYKEVTEHLFEQLVGDRQESTEKGT